MSRLERLESGLLTVTDGRGSSTFGRGGGDPQLEARMDIHRDRFYRQIALGGALAAAEAYIRGDWDSPDLVATLRVLARNRDVILGVEAGPARLWRPLRSAVHWLRRNTRSGSRRNISAHYDLNNDFFALMLDPTMTYSCGVFPRPTASLEEASREKYDRICRKLQLSPADHVLEIGSGWGGFAEHAVECYGCRVTTTTISDEQFRYAAQRFRRRALDRRITLLNLDYRDLTGRFDKLVSIEMIEAVGEQYLPTYFHKCSQLLHPDGMMCLQAITIPDQRYDSYRKSVDFIQRYIFPGGFLPSMGAMANCVAGHTDFRLVHSEDFGSHYARILACWRQNFWDAIEKVRSLGFDERFVRTWEYYLCYCEAGFRERQVGVSQQLLAKPDCRRDPVLAV